MKCPITGINIPRFILCIFAGSLFLFAFEFYWHVMTLMPTYEETPQLWREEETMPDFVHWTYIRIVVLTAVIAFIYTRNHEGKGVMEGLRFGALIGVLMGVLMASSYIWMPISEYLAMMWFAGGLITGLSLGVINALLYRPCTAKE